MLAQHRPMRADQKPWAPDSGNCVRFRQAFGHSCPPLTYLNGWGLWRLPLAHMYAIFKYMHVNRHVPLHRHVHITLHCTTH